MEPWNPLVTNGEPFWNPMGNHIDLRTLTSYEVMPSGKSTVDLLEGT